MKRTEFNKIVKARIGEIQKSLTLKGIEYARNTDRFENFRDLSVIQKTTMEKSLLNLCDKQYVSIHSFVNNLPSHTPTALWQEKIKDVINYLILLEAIVLEREQGEGGERE